MLGVEVPNGIEEWTYDKVKYFLLFHTAGTHLLVKNLREKYKYNSKKRTIFERKLRSSIHNQNLERELEDVVNELGIGRAFVDYSLLNDTIDEEFLDSVSLPIFIATSVSHLTSGFFIKVDQKTTLTTVQESFNEIQKLMIHYNKFIQKKKNYYAPAKKEAPLNNLSKSVEIALLIEKELIQGKSVTESIGTVADMIYPVENETELQKKTTAEKVQERYYEVLRYYHIPTPLQFKKLASKYAPSRK